LKFISLLLYAQPTGDLLMIAKFLVFLVKTGVRKYEKLDSLNLWAVVIKRSVL